jgi:hypothetical protein
MREYRKKKNSVFVRVDWSAAGSINDAGRKQCPVVIFHSDSARDV